MDDTTNSPKETDVTKLPAGAGNEVGYSGTYNYHGYISAEEYNTLLIGKLGLQVYDTMRRSDPTVHAALIVVKDPIIGADWDVNPASDDPVDIEIADFVRRELFENNLTWHDIIREGLTALDFGHAIFEIVYQITEFDGKIRIGLKALKSRKQRSILRWMIGESGNEKEGVSQILLSGQTAEIPREKLVYVVNEREGENYEGISLLRYAYKPWKIKDSLEIMNAVALERMSLGIPVMTKGIGGVNVGEPELATVRRALRQIRNNEEAYLELPDGVDVQMMNMQGHTTKDTLPTIERQDTMITLSVLAQFLMLGSTQTGGGGSRAVSADHSSLFVKSIEAVARMIQQAFQRDLVNRLVDLNYSNVKNGYPKLVFAGLSDDDAQLTSDAVSKLYTAGALTRDPAVENRLREMLDLPELTEEMMENYTQISVPMIAPQELTPEGQVKEGNGDATVPNPEEDPADNPGGTDSNTPTQDQKTVDKAQKTTPVDPKKQPAKNQPAKTKAEALEEARIAQKKLIDVIIRG